MNKISGIYEIRNLSNGNCYIGSSVDIRFRLKYHKCLLNKNKHYSKHLQSAWNKYGKQNFIFRPLIICDPSNNLSYEQMAIDKLCPKYNKAKIAMAPMTGLFHTEEAKQKIRLASIGKKYSLGYKQSIEHRQKISLANKGKKYPGKTLTEEHRQKIALSLIGNKRGTGYKHTEEWKEKASIRQKGNKHSAGIVRSEEFKQKISAANLGKELTAEHKKKISKSLLGNKNSAGRVLSEAHKKRIGEANKKFWAAKVSKEIGVSNDN